MATFRILCSQNPSKFSTALGQDVPCGVFTTHIQPKHCSVLWCQTRAQLPYTGFPDAYFFTGRSLEEESCVFFFLPVHVDVSKVKHKSSASLKIKSCSKLKHFWQQQSHTTLEGTIKDPFCSVLPLHVKNIMLFWLASSYV